MKRYWLRSTLFNLSFYGYTAAACFVALPTFLFPRSWFLWVIRIYLAINTALEKTILGLSYEVRGLENVPQDGSFIVAAKHQSPYETLKLHVLFEDPAVILKKELLSIPIWGQFLKKADVIAIDRSSKEKAMSSIVEGALRMKDQGRPIIIFPQGTRVAPDENTQSKPYKFGVARIYEAANLPVIPLALNAGFFYPKKSWLKRPGRVVFEFLPAIQPGLKREDFMQTLEEKLEEKSIELLQDARYAEPETAGFWPRFIVWLCMFVLLAAGYSWLWFTAADQIKIQHTALNLPGGERVISEPLYIKGFPGPLQVVGGNEFLQSPNLAVQVKGFMLEAYPLPFAPMTLETGALTFTSFRYAEPLEVDSVTLRGYISGLRSFTVTSGDIKIGEFNAKPEGNVSFTTDGRAEFDLTIALQNHDALIKTLIQKGMVEEKSALFIGAGLNAFAKDGIVRIPLTTQGSTVYAGPFAIGQISSSSPVLSSPAPVTDSLQAPAP